MKTKTKIILAALLTALMVSTHAAFAQDVSRATTPNPLADNPAAAYDPHLHLLLDPDAIIESDGISIIVNQAVKHPEPILVSSYKPYRMATAWGNVIREPGGLFRMWYLDMCINPHDQATRKVWGEGPDYGYYPKAPGDFRDIDQQFIRYAESWDGVHWTKPNLGLIEFDGSTQNNIVYAGHDAAIKTNRALMNCDGCTVVRDDAEPDPAKRYKMFAYWETVHKYDNGVSKLNRPAEDIKRFRKAAGQFVAYSPDGLRFGPLEPSGIAMTGADRNLIIRDHKRNQWRAILRPKVPANEYSNYIRASGISTSSDLKTWSELETIFVPDELDGFGGIQQIDVFIPFNYGAEDMGFVSIANQRGKGREPFLVCLGKDGKWKRIYRDQPVIPRGAPGAFDRMMTIPLQNEPILVGDEMFLYYSSGTGIAKHPAGARSIGMARLRRDAFVGIAAGVIKPKSNMDTSGEASFTTWPLHVSAPGLAVNFEKSADSAQLRVELLDENKTPIPGFTLDDCLPVVIDNIRAPITWKNKKDLKPLLGKNIHIRASFVHGVVYAFRFSNP